MIKDYLQETPLQKKMVVSLAVLFIFVSLFAATLYFDIKELQSTSRWLNHTHEVISKSHNLMKLMVDQETGLRGFLVVGKENFLEPFYSGKTAFNYEIRDLRSTVSDNPEQVGILDEIEQMAHQWHLKAVQPVIEERRKVDLTGYDISYLQELLLKGTGKSILDRQRATVNQLQLMIKTSQGLIDSGNQQVAGILAISLIKHMVDQETGQRGFLITGEESFLGPLIEGRKGFSRDFDRLQRLEGMDDELLDIVSEIKNLAQQWYQQAATPEITARREIDRNQASLKKVTSMVESEVGKQLMDKIRTKVNLFVLNERVLIAQRKQANDEIHNQMLLLATFGGVLVIITGLLIVYFINQTSKPLMRLIASMRDIAESSDFTQRVDVEGMYEVIQIGTVFNRMALNTEQQAWMKSSALEISRVLQEAENSIQLAESLVSKVGELLECGFGAFYLLNEETAKYELIGSYRFKERSHAVQAYAMGEGLVGQCALEGKVMLLNGVPETYTKIHSGLGEELPDTVMAIPVRFGEHTLAVMELAAFGSFSNVQQGLLEEQVTNIALGLRSLLNTARTNELLEETQAQAEELQVREEELNDSNALLERQASELSKSQKELKKSNTDLQTQQEELRVANEELEEKAHDLNASQAKLEEQNQALSEAKADLEKHAEQLAVSSKYKSEFLANMSHELRTPLNSLLILSRLLMDNKEGNLTDKQIDYAATVHDSGEDLLNLINDILDLSKIESGRMETHIELVQLSAFVSGIENKFKPMADKKGIDFIVNTEQAPEHWHSDTQKLNQIIKNLLSNAIKFTEQGNVTVTIGPVPDDVKNMAITVSDTGIGIPKDKRHVIFEAFQQADGTTSRKYGGTGLGLSISRELAVLLQGEIHIESEEGKGSAFTLIIPKELQKEPDQGSTESEKISDEPEPVSENSQQEIENKVVEHGLPNGVQANREDIIEVDDDRHILKKGDKALLVIEDDSRFASVVADAARERGFGVLVAQDGHSGLHFADLYEPSGIVLDIGLPDMSGWDVMDRLKSKSNTRHIPVHIMSGNDRSVDALKGGAIGFYTKPVTMVQLNQAFSRIEDLSERPVKQLLVVEDDPNQLKSIEALLEGSDVEISTATTGAEAESRIEANNYDCIVLDIGLPDTNGLNLLESLRSKPDAEQVPIVVYSGRELEPKERAKVDHYAQSVIVKNARSPERLLDDTTLFLHRVEDNLPDEQRETIRMLHDSETVFIGKKILLVDDDMRNIFSLSAVLQEKGVEVLTAANGQESLDQLAAEPDVSLVLMDIMMPEMDGYEAMRRIRAQERFKNLPIIALTAKAMKGDRAQCIEAGASDYLAKPVDTEKLLSMMRVWLYQ